MTKYHPNNDPFKEVKFISPFVSPELSCENEHPSSPLLKPELCPSGHQDIFLSSRQDSMLILHDLSFEKENFYAMDILLSTTCLYEDPNHLVILVSKLFRRMVVDAYVYHEYCKSRGCTVVLTLQLERKCSMLGGGAGNYTTINSYRRKFPWSSLRS